MTARALGQPGRDYIVYLRPTEPQPQGNGPPGAASANRQVVLEINLPPGGTALNGSTRKGRGR